MDRVAALRSAGDAERSLSIFAARANARSSGAARRRRTLHLRRARRAGAGRASTRWPRLSRAAFPLVGANTLETLLTIYALLEARVPHCCCIRNSPRQSAARKSPRPPRPDCRTDAAAILYTSGTTGRARGAVLTRRALLASAQASSANLGWQPDDCWLLAMPLARVGGLSIVTRCLIARRAVALVPAFDATRLPRWIETIASRCYRWCRRCWPMLERSRTGGRRRNCAPCCSAVRPRRRSCSTRRPIVAFRS